MRTWMLAGILALALAAAPPAGAVVDDAVVLPGAINGTGPCWDLTGNLLNYSGYAGVCDPGGNVIVGICWEGLPLEGRVYPC